MKAKNYRQILNARGYKALSGTKYAGNSEFEKRHKYNLVICTVTKDAHGKGTAIRFSIWPAKTPMNMNEFKEAEFDRQYLAKEAEKIYEAFEELKKLKSPKHIYCF